MKLPMIVLTGLLVGMAIAWIYIAVRRKQKQPPKEPDFTRELPVQIAQQETEGSPATTPPRPGVSAGRTAAPTGTSQLPAGPNHVPDEHLREAGLASVTIETPQGKKDAAEGFRLEGRREVRLEIVLQQDKK